MSKSHTSPRNPVARTGRFGLITIAVHSRDNETRCDARAEVVAQDRWLVLDPRTPIGDSTDNVCELGHSAAMATDRKPGEVLLRRGSHPLRLWAVIHDLDRLPTCRREWVASALLNLLRELAHREIESVSMPCLGCSQGVLDAQQFLLLLARAIKLAPVVHRLRITLICEPAERDTLCCALQRLDF